MHAKAKGGVNMDLATRKCKELEHFIMWSSFVASAGNEGTFEGLQKASIVHQGTFNQLLCLSRLCR